MISTELMILKRVQITSVLMYSVTNWYHPVTNQSTCPNMATPLLGLLLREKRWKQIVKTKKVEEMRKTSRGEEKCQIVKRREERSRFHCPSIINTLFNLFRSPLMTHCSYHWRDKKRERKEKTRNCGSRKRKELYFFISYYNIYSTLYCLKIYIILLCILQEIWRTIGEIVDKVYIVTWNCSIFSKCLNAFPSSMNSWSLLIKPMSWAGTP